MYIAIQQQRLLEAAMQLCLKSILLSRKSDKKFILDNSVWKLRIDNAAV